MRLGTHKKKLFLPFKMRETALLIAYSFPAKFRTNVADDLS